MVHFMVEDAKKITIFSILSYYNYLKINILQINKCIHRTHIINEKFLV